MAEGNGFFCGGGLQGTIMDNIAYNIEQTDILVEQGHEELVQVCFVWVVRQPAVRVLPLLTHAHVIYP